MTEPSTTIVYRCPECWGSHGCSLPAMHDGAHECLRGLGDDKGCSQHDGSRVRYWGSDETWTEWLDTTPTFPSFPTASLHPQWWQETEAAQIVLYTIAWMSGYWR